MLAVAVTFVTGATVGHAQETKAAPGKNAAAKKAKEKRQATQAKQAANPAFEQPEVQPGLPNVLLIGDSISIGYTVMVREGLRGEANVFRPPTNCGPTTRGVEALEEWLGDRTWDVIHFNFGLHDLKYVGPDGEGLADPAEATSRQQVPIDQYAENLRQIANRLKATGARVIWRETTPVPEGAAGRIVGDAVRYNAAAAKVMQEIGGIEIDPMYTVALEKAEQLRANVHYSSAGSQTLADQVISVIRGK